MDALVGGMFVVAALGATCTPLGPIVTPCQAADSVLAFNAAKSNAGWTLASVARARHSPTGAQPAGSDRVNLLTPKALPLQTTQGPPETVTGVQGYFIKTGTEKR